MQDDKMGKITARLRASSLNFTLVMNLYDRLNELPIPLFVGQRMKLPCLTFKLGPLSASRSRSERIFRAQTAALGIVEIKTKEDLSRFDSLYLIHPWIDFLLDRQPVGSVTETIPDANTSDRSSLMGDLSSFPSPSNIASVAKQTPVGRLAARFGLSFGGRPATPLLDAASLFPPSTVSPFDKQMRAFRLVARLRQPFGALLFTPTRQNVAEYRRVASKCLITVQVQEDTPLNVLIDNARMLDVL